MTARPPNILIVMADQMAPAFLPIYGHALTRAPHMLALAESGVVFDSAYCASPLCAPSRASFMTGLLPSRTRVYDNAAEFAAEIPTFAHHLRLRGFRTVLSGKMHFCGPDQLHGFEERLTTDIYPADFGWTPDWRPPARAAELVPQHELCRSGRRLPAHQPARLRRRGRLHRRARHLRHRPIERPAPVPSGRLLHPSARPVRRAAALLGPLSGGGHRPALARARGARSAFAPAAPCLRHGRRAGDGGSSAQRAARLFRRDLLRRRQSRPPHAGFAFERPRRGHDRDPHQRPRGDARRARPLVQDELLRGREPRAARRREPRPLRAPARGGERVARSTFSPRLSISPAATPARLARRSTDAASPRTSPAPRATTRRSANISPKARSRRW